MNNRIYTVFKELRGENAMNLPSSGEAQSSPTVVIGSSVP